MSPRTLACLRRFLAAISLMVLCIFSGMNRYLSCFHKSFPPKEKVYLECAEEAQLVLWFSSRQLDAERSLASYVGTNENSKLVIRLTAPGASGPPLPRTVDPATKDLIDKVQESRLAIIYLLIGCFLDRTDRIVEKRYHNDSLIFASQCL